MSNPRVRELPATTPAQQRLLEQLKRCGPATAGELARRLSLTAMAVRQHLAALEELGHVEQRTDAPSGRGRPAIRWSLAPRSRAAFPDRHGELTCGLIDAMRTTIGESGLLKVIDTRAVAQAAAYRRDLPGMSASLKSRVEALARRRTEEGYMAEAVREGRGAWLLIEHHCPICEAAESCTGLCSAELRVFQEALGDDVVVERTEHLLGGGDRCVYRIRRSSEWRIANNE